MKAKKTISLVLCVIMIFALAVPAFAANSVKFSDVPDGYWAKDAIYLVADAGIECPYIVEVAAGMFQYILGDVLWAHFRIPLLLHPIQTMLFNVLHECQVPALVTIIFSHCKHPLSVAQLNFRP